MRAMDESDNRSTLRKSISCVVAGLLFTVGLSMLAFAEMFDWQPGAASVGVLERRHDDSRRRHLAGGRDQRHAQAVTAGQVAGNCSRKNTNGGLPRC